MAESVSERISGGVVALRVSGIVAVLVFVALTCASLLNPHQGHRLTLLVLFVVSAAGCWAMSRVAHRLDERRAELLLLLLCLIPTVDVLFGLALLREESLTDYLYLTFFVYGLLTMRWQSLAALLAGATVVWTAEAVWLGFSSQVVVHDVIQLVLRGAVAFAVFKIRSRLEDELRKTGRELDDQVAALARTRELHGRELSRYRTMFEDGPLGIMVLDRDGVALDANRAMMQMLQLSREQLVGSVAETFVHPDDRMTSEQLRTALEQLATSDAINVERRFLRSDGVAVPGSVTSRSISGPDGEPWTLIHARDVTQRRAMELDLIRSRDGLRAVADIALASQRGADPRPVALAHIERLAGANHVSLMERLTDSTLVITESLQPELRGLEIDLTEMSATAHVWNTGEELFLADAATSPLVNLDLLGIGGMTSLMWHPVGAQDDLCAVISIAWPETVDGVTDLARDAVRTLAAELSTALIAERLRNQLEEKSRLDPLTGLMNRRGWNHGMAELVRDSRQTGRPFVLAVADLDRFKQFNDEFGHLEGDILLAGFAANARTSMRDLDLLARWGGEEFAVALRDCDLSDAQPVLERIRSAVPAGRTCSIGFATFHPEETVDECMRRADAALYLAKANGRDRMEYSHYEAPSGGPGPATEGRIPDRRRAR